MSDNPLLVYLHVPKTAGTSFDELLQQNYGADYYRTRNRYYKEPLWKKADQYANRYQAIGGHMTFGLHGMVKRPCRYISFVRDPLSRMISLYWYILSHPAHTLHPFVVNLPFGEWLLGDTAAALDNDLVRFFSGRMQFGVRSGVGRAVTEQDCRRAIANINDHFDYVGVFEELEQSVNDMALLYGWEHGYDDMHHLQMLDPPGGVHERPRPDAIDADLSDAFVSRNKWDYALCSYVLARFVYGGADE